MAAPQEIDFEAEGLLEGLEGPARDGRLKLLRELAGDGVSLDELRAAVAEGRLALLPVERVYSPQGRRYSGEEIAAQVGLDVEYLTRHLQALGLAAPDPTEKVHTDSHLASSRLLKQFLDAGLSAESIIENARHIGMSMSQLALADRTLIGETFLREGDTEYEVAMRFAAAARAMSPLLGELLRSVHDMHLVEAIRQEVLSDEEIAAGPQGSDEIAVAFADLVGFTSLGERLGIDEIGDMSRRLTELATDAVEPPVRLVKMIGDAAMLVGPEPEPLLRATMDLVEAVDAAEELPAMRAGLAWGEALSRGGDWYGRPVNLASRITGFARPESVVVDAAAKDAIGGEESEGFGFSFAGRRRFKGIKGEVPVYRARRRPAPA